MPPTSMNAPAAVNGTRKNITPGSVLIPVQFPGTCRHIIVEPSANAAPRRTWLAANSRMPIGVLPLPVAACDA
jgi:hypothetical protein